MVTETTTERRERLLMCFDAVREMRAKPTRKYSNSRSVDPTDKDALELGVWVRESMAVLKSQYEHWLRERPANDHQLVEDVDFRLELHIGGTSRTISFSEWVGKGHEAMRELLLGP